MDLDSLDWTHGIALKWTLEKPRKVDSPKKKKVKKPQDGRQKSGQNIGYPYQMEDNKAATSAPPQGGGASRRPLGFLLSSIW